MIMEFGSINFLPHPPTLLPVFDNLDPGDGSDDRTSQLPRRSEMLDSPIGSDLFGPVSGDFITNINVDIFR
jgi:hypothetical protein